MIGWLVQISVVLAALLGLTGPARAADLHGIGKSVTEGDEFVLCEVGACTDIRLCGLDTPSRGRPGYDATVAALAKLVVGKPVLCRPVGEGSVCDKHTAKISRGRTVAQCFVEEYAIDVAGALIAAGLGCDRSKGSGGYYSKDHPEWECKR